MLTSSYLFLYLLLFFIAMVLVLGFYLVYRLRRNRVILPAGELPDPRFMGSTVFLVGESGMYKGAVIPIPMEGITIGSNVEVANMIINNLGIASKHVFISFPYAEYDALLIEEYGGEAGTFYMLSSEQGNWNRLQGSKRFSKEASGKIRVGNNQDIFDITFRL